MRRRIKTQNGPQGEVCPSFFLFVHLMTTGPYYKHQGGYSIIAHVLSLIIAPVLSFNSLDSGCC